MKSNTRLMAFVLAALLAAPAGCGTQDAPDDDAIDAIESEVTDATATGDLHDLPHETGDTTDGYTADGDDADTPDADSHETYDAVDPDFFIYNDVPTFCVAGLECMFSFKIQADPDNPFDPDEIDVRATITTPTGATYVRPAFYWIPFEDYGGKPGPAMEPASWSVTFLPDSGGLWKVEIMAVYRGKQHVLRLSEFPIDEAGPNGKWGIVRVSPRDARYLEFQDGTPYFPVGENMCWYDDDVTDYTGSGDEPGWMKKLADNGGNFMRLWMASWAFALEWTYPEGSVLGDYGPRMDRAWALDRVFRKAQALDLKVMLSLFNHGQFSTSSNTQWANNPYNAVNGGPLTDAADFFTDETARRLTRNRIRYIVARWGASPALMSWELFNEVDLTDQHDAATIGAWHEEMAGLIKSLDPYGRIVTTSLSGIWDIFQIDQAVYPLEDIDLVQVHHYGNDLSKFDIIAETPELAQRHAAFGKPVLFAELGVHYGGPSESMAVDPMFLGLHDLIWAPVFSATAGTGMTWWWDNLIDPQDQYYQFKALSDFVDGIDWPGEGFVATTMPVTGSESAQTEGIPETVAFALIGSSTVLVWIKNTTEKYWQMSDPDAPALIDDRTLDLSGLPDGDWTARWYDPFGWTVYEPETTVVDNTVTAMPVRGFTHDIALRLTLVQ